MSITLCIPDSIARSLRIPEAEAEGRVREELAVALYASNLLSFGKAAELVAASRSEFSDVLARRDVARHYGPEELSEDTGYANGE